MKHKKTKVQNQNFFQFVVAKPRRNGFIHFLMNQGLSECINHTHDLGGVIVYYLDIFTKKNYKEIKDILNRYQPDFL